MRSQFWMSVLLGGFLAGLVWVLLLPGKDEAQAALPRPKATKAATWVDKGRSLFKELNDAGSEERKLDALARLQDLKLKELKSEMENFPLSELRGELSFGVKVMILRLAEIDPLDAVAFIREQWIRYDDDDNYVHEVGQAWRLVSAEWAHQNPMEMLEFWKETQKTQNHSFRIHKDDLANLLLAGRPLGSMTLYHYAGDYSPWHKEEFLSRLRIRRDFEEVLETWNNPPTEARERWEKKLAEARFQHEKDWIENERNPQRNSLAQLIIQRWKEVDEEGFLGSEFTSWEKGE